MNSGRKVDAETEPWTETTGSQMFLLDCGRRAKTTQSRLASLHMALRIKECLEKIQPNLSYPEPEARTEPRSTTPYRRRLSVVPTPGGATWSCVPSIVLMEDLCPAVQFYLEHIAGVDGCCVSRCIYSLSFVHDDIGTCCTFYFVVR